MNRFYVQQGDDYSKLFIPFFADLDKITNYKVSVHPKDESIDKNTFRDSGLVMSRFSEIELNLMDSTGIFFDVQLDLFSKRNKLYETRNINVVRCCKIINFMESDLSDTVDVKRSFLPLIIYYPFYNSDCIQESPVGELRIEHESIVISDRKVLRNSPQHFFLKGMKPGFYTITFDDKKAVFSLKD